MKRLLLLAAAFAALVSSASAQDWAKARLDKSPRHLEWVTVKHDGRDVICYIGYPEIKTKAPAVIVIHEIFGLSDWVRTVVDELAEAGYIAIAPDLLSGLGAKGGGTAELNSTEVGQKIRTLPADQITADLNAVAAYATKLPACNGKLAVTGYCWGGGQSFRYATNSKNLKTAFVFYGSAPTEDAELARVSCPIYGAFAGNDARINATLPKTAEQMKAAGKVFEQAIYDGAGHGFMRAGVAPPPEASAERKALEGFAANKQARDAAWKRMLEVLGKI